MTDAYEIYKSIFSENLNKYMMEKGITTKEICDSLGVTKATVSDWRNGKKMPRMRKIDALVSLFGIKRSDLLEKKEPPAIGGKANELVSIINRLNDENLDRILDYARILLQSQ